VTPFRGGPPTFPPDPPRSRWRDTFYACLLFCGALVLLAWLVGPNPVPERFAGLLLGLVLVLRSMLMLRELGFRDGAEQQHRAWLKALGGTPAAAASTGEAADRSLPRNPGDKATDIMLEQLRRDLRDNDVSVEATSERVDIMMRELRRVLPHSYVVSEPDPVADPVVRATYQRGLTQLDAMERAWEQEREALIKARDGRER
jgi:hypothetical protein